MNIIDEYDDQIMAKAVPYLAPIYLGIWLWKVVLTVV
jgi:hypothetical protein